jgi:hypothetical protein
MEERIKELRKSDNKRNRDKKGNKYIKIRKVRKEKELRNGRDKLERKRRLAISFNTKCKVVPVLN